MKLTFLLALQIFFCVEQIHAQSVSSTIEYIDINNIKAAHLVHGDMWRNPTLVIPSCEYPQGSGKHLSNLGSLWMSGYDNDLNLRVAAETFRQTGIDFFPGPVDTSLHGAAAVAQSVKWAKIWKVNRTAIDSFRQLSTHTVTNTPLGILTWPAKGNPYAKGDKDSALVIDRDLAPFVDVNSDGNYNPLNGDYPKIKGDQMLWWIINDYSQPKTNTTSLTMGLEIQNFAYGYKYNGVLSNVLFYEYLIRNIGLTTLSDFRFGFNNEVDLGYASDDYIGFDSSRRMGYAYNAKSPDGGGASGYGTNIPVVGVTFLEVPGDVGAPLVPLGCFNYYHNSTGNTGYPDNALAYHRLLNAQNRIGEPMVNDRSAGQASSAYTVSGGPAVRYAFSGDPSDPFGWSQCQNALPKTEDRRYVMATEGFTLAPQAVKKIAFALVVSPDGGACPMVNLAGIHTTADSAMYVYWNPPSTGIQTPFQASRTLNIYPNPAKDVLFIKPAISTNGQVSIVDVTGRSVAIEKSVNGQLIRINISNMAPGVYTVIYKDGARMENNVFVKE